MKYKSSNRRFLIKPATASEIFKATKTSKKKQQEVRSKLIQLGILEKEIELGTEDDYDYPPRG